jgi:hypothetical protein
MKRKTMATWRNLLPARGMDLSKPPTAVKCTSHRNSVLDDSDERLAQDWIEEPCLCNSPSGLS